MISCLYLYESFEAGQVKLAGSLTDEGICSAGITLRSMPLGQLILRSMRLSRFDIRFLIHFVDLKSALTVDSLTKMRSIENRYS